MKWDLFQLIVKQDGCLCTSAEEQNIFCLRVPPYDFPSHSLVDPPAQIYMSIKQPWLQQRANSLPPNNPQIGPKLTLNGSKLVNKRCYLLIQRWAVCQNFWHAF